MDTDCPYCWVDGDEMSQLHSQWSDRVNFVTIAAELSIPDHDSTRGEIEAFRDKTHISAVTVTEMTALTGREHPTTGLMSMIGPCQ